jgi:hypothetical protein
MVPQESRLIRFSLVFFFVLLIGYGMYAASALLWGPRIALPEGTIIVSEPHALIRGAAENVASLALNGTVVTMTEEGVFEKQVALMPGTNRFVLTAHDKYGRSREEALDILYLVSPEERRPPPRTPRGETATTTESATP